MFIQKKFKIEDIACYEGLSENALCFDIETTGLNRARSYISVIGTGFVKDGYIIFKQWLLDDLSLEEKMLEEFSEYMNGFDTIIQFNGNSFDIPFVRARSEMYGLDDPFKDMDVIDYYVNAKKHKNMLALADLKQKSLETLFNINRKDRISGRECITAFQRYLAHADAYARDALLLHNEEDVLGLLKLSPISLLDEVFENAEDMSVDKSYLSNDDASVFVIGFSLKKGLPFKIDCHADTHILQIRGDRGVLYLKGNKCCRRYYFPNYKDYFYLPYEDRAIHKSVGIYVEKDCRVKATKQNCYERSEDVFFYQPSDIVSPALREKANDKCSWVNADSLLKASEDDMKRLCRSYLTME